VLRVPAARAALPLRLHQHAHALLKTLGMALCLDVRHARAAPWQRGCGDPDAATSGVRARTRAQPAALEAAHTVMGRGRAGVVESAAEVRAGPH